MTDYPSPLDRLLDRHEGVRFDVYDDATGHRITKGTHVKGHPTTAVGFNLDAHDLPRWVVDGLRAYVRYAAELDVVAIFLGATPPSDSPRFGALVDMVVTMGRDGVNGFPKMLAAVVQHRWDDAAVEVEDSLWAREEAPERAAEVAAMLRHNRWPWDAHGRPPQDAGSDPDPPA